MQFQKPAGNVRIAVPFADNQNLLRQARLLGEALEHAPQFGIAANGRNNDSELMGHVRRRRVFSTLRSGPRGGGAPLAQVLLNKMLTLEETAFFNSLMRNAN